MSFERTSREDADTRKGIEKLHYRFSRNSRGVAGKSDNAHFKTFQALFPATPSA